MVGDINPLETPAPELDPEAVTSMHEHIAELLRQQRDAGADVAALEDIGLLKEEAAAPTADERALAAAEASGQLVLDFETWDASAWRSAEPTVAATPETPAAPVKPAPAPPARPKRLRQRPKARTSREKAARDSRPDLKPFPYGTRED